jgi:hypothetical protein
MFSPQHIAKGTAIALTLGAVAAPAASAGPIADNAAAQLRHTQVVSTVTGSHPFGPNRPVPVAAKPLPSLTFSRQDKQLVPRSEPLTPVSTSTPVVRVSNPTGGFDWADAAIGAGGGVALSILGIGGALALQRRSRKPAVVHTGASAVATG